MSFKKWLCLIIIFGTGAFYLFLPYNLPFSIKVDRDEAIKIAHSFIKQRGYEPEGYHINISFEEAKITSYFLQKVGKFQEVREILNNKFFLWYWKIRYYKPGQEGGFKFRINPDSGKVIYFFHKIPENKETKSVSGDKAKQIATQYLKSQGVDLSKFSLTYSSVPAPHRLDHRFTLKYNPEDSQQMKVQYHVGIYGNKIGNYVINIDIPKKIYRAYRSKFSLNIYPFIFIIATVILFVAVIIYSILLTKRGYNLAWKNSFILSLFLLVFILISIANNPSFILNSYTSSMSMPFYITILSIVMAVILIIFTGSFILIFAVSEKLSHITWKKSVVTFLKDFPYLRTKQFAEKILFGYALGSILVLLISLLYTLLQGHIKIWNFVPPLYTQAISTKLTFIVPITYSLLTALSEEFLFRAISITILKRILRITWLAILTAAIIWGVGHVTMDIPPLIKIIQVTVLGIILGIFFLKFGIETTIFAHFFINSVLMSLYFIKLGLTYSGYIALAIILIPLLTLLSKKHYPNSLKRIP